MKENMKSFFKKVKTYWKNQSTIQKAFILGIIFVTIFLTVLISFKSINKKFVPLYDNLSLQEIGQIKSELESRGIPYKLENGGQTITVPEDQASSVLVDLASQSIPKSGNIDYSFFGENASWGITDQEFNMIKLSAMNTELANLIKKIEGIQDAKVMITLPNQSVFVSDAAEEASASIIIHTELGYQFQKNQIESLYHLVSKAVPNLPKENIVIRNQYLEYYDDYLSEEFGDHHTYTYQRTVKKEIEKDIQRRIQQMLGAMIGMNHVIVSVTADIDFTKENRIEELVEPVDLENLEGIPVSIETIHETYLGNPASGGIAGVGQEEVAGSYEAVDLNENGEYELVKETINNEFNHIRKEIFESPFKVRDLGIQVAVNNVVERKDEQVQYLTEQEQNNVAESISSILHSIIASSIDKEYGEINPDEKISIVFQEFSGIETISPETIRPAIPLWIYVIGIILFILILILVFLLIRNQKRKPLFTEAVMEEGEEDPEVEVEVDTPAELRRKQIERMANEQPEDFARLLRSWIVDD